MAEKALVYVYLRTRVCVCVCVQLCVLRALPKEMADVVTNGEGMADGLGELITKRCLNRW